MSPLSYHFPPNSVFNVQNDTSGLRRKSTFSSSCFALWKSLSLFSWFWDQWRAARNESNQEAITLGAADTAHMRPAMGAKGANTTARLASPQLLVVLWWWRRDSLCPGMSSTPQIRCCEWRQYLAGCFFTRQGGKGTTGFWNHTCFGVFLMDLKEVVQRRRWPWELKCFPAFCQGFCKTMKQLDIVIVTGSVGHLLLGVFCNNFSISVEEGLGPMSSLLRKAPEKCIAIPCKVARGCCRCSHPRIISDWGHDTCRLSPSQVRPVLSTLPVMS